MMVTVEDMLNAYFDCRKKKRCKESSLKFEINYEDECVKLVHLINERKYEIGTSIAFFVTRPKKREVFAASFRDRVVHHWLALRLEPLFEAIFIEDTYNCRKGKGTDYGIKRLYDKVKKYSDNYTKDCYIGKFDMKGFFMSIDRNILWNALKAFIEKNYKNPVDFDDVMYVAEKIVNNCPEQNCDLRSPKSWWKDFPEDKSLFTCGEGKGLPIGNLTSQMLANFYMHDFDKLMVNIYGDGYGRYVDDFFIISDDKQKILGMINFIKNWLSENLKVNLHPNKISVQHYSKGIKFIGGVVKKNRRYTGNETIDKFLQLITFINKNPDVYTTDEVLSRLNSYLGFLRHTNSYNIKRRALDGLSDYLKSKLIINEDYIKVSIKEEETQKVKIRNLIKNGAEF